jgi:hypothetical protein
MTRETAKFILRAYRLDGQDQSDPQFAEALEMAQRDPELARWFAEEQEVDRRLARSFGSFPTPPDLAAQLLAVQKVVVVPFWQRRPVWLAAAAAIVMLLGLVFVTRGPRPGAALAANAPAELLRLAEQGPHINFMAASFPDLQKWLREQPQPADFTLPERLQTRRFEGCRILDWQGRRVTMLCLDLAGKHVDLFVLDASQLPSLPASGQPQFARVGEISTATWTRDGKTFLLAGKFEPKEVQAYL